MQLGKTNIAIRERGLLEILDLSLHIVRDYFAPLSVCLLVGVVPLAIINHLLFGWMLDFEYGIGFPYRFIWITIFMITIEAPVAGVLMTAFLGQAVFDKSPTLGFVLNEIKQAYSKIFVSGWMFRGVLPAMALFLFIIPNRDFNPFVEVFMFPVLLIVALGIRAFRPFSNEVIILEKTPIVARYARELSLRRRSINLHNPRLSVHFAHGLMIAMFAVVLSVVLMGGFMTLSGIFLHDWRQGPIMIGICFPIVLWVVVGYFTVVKFLCYLDTRIRQEGWEVEILIRAEAVALNQRMT